MTHMHIQIVWLNTMLNHIYVYMSTHIHKFTHTHTYTHTHIHTHTHTHTQTERIKACAKIKGFWVNTMLNHPQLKDLVSQNDEECLMNLNEVDVQEIDDENFQVCVPVCERESMCVCRCTGD